MKKPKKFKAVIFCYSCGRQLWGFSKRTELINIKDGHIRTFHKICAKMERRNNPYLWKLYKEV